MLPFKDIDLGLFFWSYPEDIIVFIPGGKSMKALGVMLAAGVVAVLAGCSFAPFIHSDSLAFDDTIASVSNELLVTNILRARDHAPLHFANLSALRAQFQATASAQAVFPFGAFSRTAPVVASGSGVGSSATRASNTDILQLQTAPSFDFSPLDTQEFTRGILSPIDPQVVKYYFDGDMPQELLLFLFVSRVTPGKPSFRALNAPTTGPASAASAAPDEQDLVNDPERPEKFKQFAAWVRGIFGDYRDSRVIMANSYLRQIGPPIAGSTGGKEGGAQFKDLTTVDSAKVHVECFDTGTKTAPAADGKHCDDGTVNYKLITYAEPTNVILCAKEQYFFVPLALASADMNDPRSARGYAPQINLWKQLCTSAFAPGTSDTEVGTIYIRSVEGIIQYLGALISERYGTVDQAALRDAVGYTLFNLRREDNGARFGISYNGKYYFVPEYDSAADRTLETLALVKDLLNLDTKANELPTTRAVEIVP